MTQLLNKCSEKMDFDQLSENPNFQIEWFDQFPNKKWNLNKIIQNPNFQLEWIVRYPDKPWSMKELNERIKKGDLLLMPNTIAKLKDYKSTDYYKCPNSYYGVDKITVLDFDFLSSYSFERENEILKKQWWQKNCVIYTFLIKHIDRKFIQHVLLSYLIVN